MIEMVTGKPGAGKSFWLTRESIAVALQFPDWGIVGNLPWLMDELQNYFTFSGIRGHSQVWVKERFRRISDEETGEFWRFTPWFTVLPSGSAATRREYEALRARRVKGDKLQEKEMKRMNALADAAVAAVAEISTDGGFPPCLQIIDEAHLRFDSRKWDEASDALTTFNSQHRKLRWRCIFGTQFLGLIDKRIKGFAEKYRVFKNMFGQRKWNFIEMPKRMRELVYTVEPGPNAGDPDEEHWWSFDMRVAKCYDTTAGVGIKGGGKAEHRGGRGFKLPWWSVFVGLVVGAWLFATAVKKGANSVKDGFSNFTTSHLPAEEKKAGVQGMPSPAGLPPPVRQNDPPRQTDAMGRNTGVTASPPLRMVGSVVTKDMAKAYLSDGRVLNGKPGKWLTAEYCILPDGRQIWRERPVPRGTTDKGKH